MSNQTDPLSGYVIVGCGAAKVDTDLCVPARELYTSNYFKLKRDVAEFATEWADSVEWRILSAKHGLIHPDDHYEPYDCTVDDLNADARDVWGQQVNAELEAWLSTADQPGDSAESPLIILAGESYVSPLEKRSVFQEGIEAVDRPLTLSYPFRQQDFSGIGDQMSWLKVQSNQDAQPTLGEF
jgi:hypothetical protein